MTQRSNSHSEPLDQQQAAAAAEALAQPEVQQAAAKAETKRQAELMDRGKAPLGTVLLASVVFGGCGYALTRDWAFAGLGVFAGVVAANAYVLVVRTIKLGRAARER